MRTRCCCTNSPRSLPSGLPRRGRQLSGYLLDRLLHHLFNLQLSVGPVPAGARLSGYLLGSLLHHLFNLQLSVGPVPAGARLSGYLLDRLLHHLFNLQLSVGPVPAGGRLSGYLLGSLLHHLFNLQLSVGPAPAGARLAGYVSAESIVASAGTGPTESRTWWHALGSRPVVTPPGQAQRKSNAVGRGRDRPSGSRTELCTCPRTISGRRSPRATTCTNSRRSSHTPATGSVATPGMNWRTGAVRPRCCTHLARSLPSGLPRRGHD